MSLCVSVKGSEVKHGEMPSDWRAAGGVYRLKYTHPFCEDSLILVVAVPMGNLLAVNGESAHIQF